MAYTNKQIVHESYRSLVICVDSYEQRQMSGRLCHCSFTQHKSFSNLMQLLLLIEQTVEEIDYPSSSTQKRVFRKAEANFDPPVCCEMKEATGAAATFRVRILFRQNASWQGVVSWLEGGCEETFRSALELVMLMDNAILNPAPCDNE